nr:hypothetical protein [Tanacetum cinerariifolium]
VISSASSAVTYTSVYTDSEPRRVFWGADEELLDGEPIYPEYIPLEDERVLPDEEQPLPLVVSPTAESPEYVAESDSEEDPKEYADNKTEDGPVDYPMDEGDDGDDDDGDSSRDDADNEDEDGEEHLAPDDSAVIIPTDELAAISLPLEAEVERLLAMPTPLPSPLTSLSPPSAGYEVGQSSTARPSGGRGIDYGVFSTLDAEARRRGIGEVRYGIRDTWRVDLLMEGMIAHQETIHIVEEEAYAAREAWAHSIGLRQTVHSELQTHREQAKLLALREQPRRARQPGGDARVPNHHDAPKDGTEGVLGLTRWIVKMESVFQISCCAIENQEHFARDYRSSGNANVANAQRNNGENPKGNGCFECGAPRHFKRDFP